jgi:hypothetical protein
MRETAWCSRSFLTSSPWRLVTRCRRSRRRHRPCYAPGLSALRVLDSFQSSQSPSAFEGFSTFPRTIPLLDPLSDAPNDACCALLAFPLCFKV